MSYVPDPVTNVGSLEELARFLQQEHERIAQAISKGNTIPMLSKEPERKSDWTLVGADGTNWNPGKGRGIYVWLNNQWNIINATPITPDEGGGPDVPPDPPPEEPEVPEDPDPTPEGTPDWYSSFETSKTEKTGPVYDPSWWFQQSKDHADRIRLVSGGRDGAKCVEFKTTGSDTQVNGSNTWERAEINLNDVKADGFPGKTQWWAVSILLPDEFVDPTVNNANHLVTQWHSTLSTGQPTMCLEVVRHNHLAVPICWRMRFHGIAPSQEISPRIYPFPGVTIARNVWYDLVMNVKWSSDNTGFWKVWFGKSTDAELKKWADFSGKQTCYGSTGNYIKCGSYHHPHGNVESRVRIDRVVKGQKALDVTPLPLEGVVL